MKDTLVKHHAPFTQIANDLINHKEISLKAKGLYSFMYSKPPNWKFTISSMAKQLPEGKDAIASGLQELRTFGWVEFTKNNDGTGEYTLMISPKPENPDLQPNPKPENPNPENPIQGKSGCINNKDSYSNKDFSNKERLLKIKEGGVPENEKKYYDLAIAFYRLFEKNLNEAGSTTSQLEKSTYKGFVDPIRLMVQRDKITLDQFRKLYAFLGRSTFWKKNILSTSKLRIQAPKLLIEANNVNGSTTKQSDFASERLAAAGAGTGAKRISDDYLERLERESQGL